MSLVQLPGPERPPSPRSTIILSSNNPFRNRTASPLTPTFNIPPTPPERPVSRNPFFDESEPKSTENSQPRPILPSTEMPWNSGSMTTQKPGPGFMDHTVDLFNNLKLNARLPEDRAERRRSPPMTDSWAKVENVPPASRGRTIPTHRPSRSNEQGREQSPFRKNPRGPPPLLDIFADPPATEKHRRPRRNSESSVADKPGRLLDPEDERRRRERRYRDKDGRSRGEARRPQTARPKKPSQRLDLIDQLDVTSIYGTGLFHHDGPFDACHPHRNRKGSQRAPMQAFPIDSANNIIGGSGPLNKDIDLAQFHGRGAEGFTDYSASGAAPSAVETFESYAGASAPVRAGPGSHPGIDRTPNFNPTARVEPVHGDESMGLGTSTFLEGAPASRTAIQRRESESDQAGGVFGGGGGGLGRKKSLVQKIRGMSNTNRGAGTAIRVTSPDRSQEGPKGPVALHDGHPFSAGGIRNTTNTNPFFNDLDDPQEPKNIIIPGAEEKYRFEANGARERAISSPKRQAMGGLLERRITNETAGPINGESKSGGFLSRVKSLKGGRRAKQENRE